MLSMAILYLYDFDYNLFILILVKNFLITKIIIFIGIN